MGIFQSIRQAIVGDREMPPAPPGDTAPRNPHLHVIDIENQLDDLPGADHLNWRTSMVDLLQLIGVDSSLEARQALAAELGYDGPLDGSPEMDNWLHTRTLQELESAGLRVPPEFLE